MATTITVSLFLPHTVAFNQPVQAQGRRREPPFKLHRRATSTLDLPTRVSQMTLFDGTTPPATPGLPQQSQYQHAPKARLDSFFDVSHDSCSTGDTHSPHVVKSIDPRSLVRNETNADWGVVDLVLNQPPSSSKPLPSDSIRDFAEVYEELKVREERQPRREQRQKKQPTLSTRSGNFSPDKSYEGRSWTVEPAVRGNSGLTNAMRAVSGSNGDIDVTWVGSIGFPTDSLPDSVKEAIRDRLLNDYQSVVVYCSDKDIDGHYAHFCKTILWPIFHYQVPDHPKSKAYADHSWKFYKQVNRAFADQVIAAYKKGDTIWVHDYHLLLVPGMLREKLPDAKIGVFLHTAFPSSEIFRCLATRTELLMGMLGANLIGFQSEEYATHFLQTCGRILTVEATGDGVQLEDHFVNVVSRPIGIDPDMFTEARKDPQVQEWIEKLLEQYGDKYVIVGRDQLDNVHGVRQKLLAYEMFLNTEPTWRDKVIMVQVATSATEQTELLSMVTDIISRIETNHASLGGQQPLTFLKQDIVLHQYLALLAAADVMMISPLRDGMNLTPHEYIFCQDGDGLGKKHGPLILSEFTGSAGVLQDGHLSVNPWDYKGQARAIKKALEMSAEEKQARWARLHDIVLRETGANWAQKLAQALDEAYALQNERACSAVPRLSITDICAKYRCSKKRLFIIDYEGTLAPHKTHTGVPLGSPVRVIDTLNDLMADPRNIVYVMSGWKPEDLENHFRTIPKVGLIAEDGCFVREYGLHSYEWVQFINSEEVMKWKSEVRGILKYHQERLEHSYIEERHASFVFHYEKAEDQEAASRQAGECAEQISGGSKITKLRAIHIEKAILIEQEGYSKATAADWIVNELSSRKSCPIPPDFLMIVGDDRSDEAVFHWANAMAADNPDQVVFTITAGKRNTEARTSLTQGATGLLNVLQKMAKLSADDFPEGYSYIPRNRSFPA